MMDLANSMNKKNNGTEKKFYDVIIIGGGPGGYAAALYCARAGLSTLLLEEMAVGGQMSTTGLVENYPGFDQAIGGFELAQKMQAGAERFGAETLYASAQAIFPEENPKRVQTSQGEFFCLAFILAMGASPRKLGLAGEAEMTGRGISYCATCDGNFFRGKTVAVAGGGNSAAADALSLSAICNKVYLIHRGSSLRAEGRAVQLLEAAPNVEILFHSTIKELLYETVLQGVVIEKKDGQNRPETEIISCDGLFVAIGRIPNTALCKESPALDPQGYIIAGEDTKTSVPGVYAAGDLRTKPLRQIITAAADGATAAVFAEEYIRSLSSPSL